MTTPVAKWLFFQTCAGFIAGVVFLAVVHSYLPELEGRYYPPVAEFRIERVETDYKGGSLIWGTARRLREECNFKRVEWFWGDPHGRNVQLPFKIIEGPKIRGNGVFEFGPFFVGFAPEGFLDQTFAFAYHSCHLGYLTQTLIYPPDKKDEVR